MGVSDLLRGLGQAINRAYERRIRAASMVKEYQVGGHGHAADHHADHAAAADELRHEPGTGHAVVAAHAGEPTSEDQPLA